MNLPESGYTPLNLRVLMTERNMSSQFVAKALGVKDVTVSRWRTGRSTMPHDKWLLVLQLKT